MMIEIVIDPPSSVLVRPRGYLGTSFDKYRACLDGTKWDAPRKASIAPFDIAIMIANRLKDAGFSVDMNKATADALIEHHRAIRARIDGSGEILTNVERELTERGLALYPFQRAGVTFLASRDRALLGDPTGVGKTIQTLAAIPKRTGVIVVTRSSVRVSWQEECRKWRPDLTPSLPDTLRWPEQGELLVYGYEQIARSNVAALPEPPRGVLVVGDEAQYLTNPKNRRTTAFRLLAKTARDRSGLTWLLSATPFNSKPTDLYSVLESADLAREAFGTFKNFAALFEAEERLLEFRHKPTIRTYEFPENITEESQIKIAAALQRVMLRRRKETVLPELPHKTRRYLRVDIDDDAKRTLDAFVTTKGGQRWLEDDEAMEELADDTSLSFRQYAPTRSVLARGKIAAAKEIAETFRAEEEPLVAFSMHRDPILALGRLPGWGTIIGGKDNPTLRGRVIRRFQAGSLAGIAATIQSAGAGITLTRSWNVLFIDRSWVPNENLQAEDRLHRLGQVTPVLVTVLVANHPLDARVEAVNERKTKQFEASVTRAEVDG